MEWILDFLARAIGVEPATVVLFMGLLYAATQFVVKIIPDDSTGWRAVVRKIAAVVAVYTPNRVTSGVTISDVARGAIAQGVKPVGKDDMKMGGE